MPKPPPSSRSTSAGSITQLGAITGGGDLLKQGTGTLLLSQANAIRNTTIARGHDRLQRPGRVRFRHHHPGRRRIPAAANVSLLGSPSSSAMPGLHFRQRYRGANPRRDPASRKSARRRGGRPSHFRRDADAQSLDDFQFGQRHPRRSGRLFSRAPSPATVGHPNDRWRAPGRASVATNSFMGDVKVLDSCTILELAGAADAIPDGSNVFVVDSTTLRWPTRSGRPSRSMPHGRRHGERPILFPLSSPADSHRHRGQRHASTFDGCCKTMARLPSR